MADLQELVSRLKAQTSEQSSGQSQAHAQPSIWAVPHSYQHPSVSSPLVSPPIHTPNPIHSSNIISPAQPSSAAGTPGPDQNRTNTLLSLLKFNNQPGQTSHAGPMANLHNIGASRSSSIHAAPTEGREGGGPRPLSASDLMATLQRSSSSSGAQFNPMNAAGLGASSSPNPQDTLLNLLTKPKSQQSSIQPIGPPEGKRVDTTETHDPDMSILTKRLAETAVKSVDTQRAATPVRQFGSPAADTTHFEAPQPTRATMFSYVNPFEQLHSSSPLNRGPKSEAQIGTKKFEILKHDRDASSSVSEQLGAPAVKARKVDNGDDTSATLSTESDTKNRSVSEALEDVGEQVGKQVEKALAETDTKPPPLTTARASTAATTATKPRPGAKQVPAPNDEVESSWESAGDDEDVSKSDEYKVEVYNFPMKPFVSLQIKDTPRLHAIRQDNFMVIAQLKKEFDQIDRSLVTASQTHIVYAQVATKKDNGGFRIIRQDSGDHKQVFRSSGERIFSVQLCADSGDVETVLGTGVNGSVFWTSLDKSRGDVFADDDIEAQGFIMPPITTAEENTSGSPVKTRARLSSRHPEFFAVARGKQIFIVSPQIAKNPNYLNAATHKVDSEAFFADHTLKINTGKAGKDFCFSEDDTVVVSLDKNGRFKFWDIRDLTNRATDDSVSKHEPIELREPLWTMNAAASGSKPEEKPSVSSIMFLDKERPVSRGMALRYVIIGFKQNHILQLWDLGLGKAVQEIRLPHEKDSDGICSISYHPKTGIVAIGHPTRNSIYFIHLSAPKYTVPHMQQAQYINMIAHNDPGLPKPESTAIMSGLREVSFAKVGQLRSVDMLKTPVENNSERNTADETVFELYVMHSKGIVGISIKRNDLGWDATNKMVNPKDAKNEGLIEINELIQPPKLPTPSEPGSATDSVPKPVGKPAKTPATPKSDGRKEASSAQAPTNGTRGKDVASDKPTKQAHPQVQTQPPAAAEPPAAPVASTKAPTTTAVATTTTAQTPVSSAVGSTQPPHVPVMSLGSEEFNSVVSKHFDTLYQRIDSDKRVQDATTGARQEALLRLVSSTLTENVERSLSTIISSRIEKDVIPVLTDSTTKLIDRKLGELFPPQLSASVSSALKSALPNALHQALKDKEIHRIISDTTANQVAAKVQQHVSQLLQQSLPDMASQATKKMIHDLETRTNQKLQHAALQHEQDNKKIEELSGLVHNLSHMVQQLSKSQAATHAELQKIHHEIKAQQHARDSTELPASTSALTTTESPQTQQVDDEIMQMTQLLELERYEEATIQWISSDRQAEIFDKLFVRVNPQYLEYLSPLVALTVSAAITSSFDTFIEKRLDWLGSVLAQINVRDADIKDVAPKIMDVLSQRLQGVYMELSEADPRNPCLKEIASLNRQVADIRRMAG